jgi:hypothetical protein
MKTLAIFFSMFMFLCLSGIAQQKEENTSTVNTEKVSMDQNYKHQAGKQYDNGSEHLVIKEAKTSDSPDANYKHQAGKRKNKEENVLTIKSERSAVKRDNNYKHQFPSR